MRNLFTRFNFSFPSYFLIAVCLFLTVETGKLNAQCNVTTYGTLAAAPTCSPQNLRGVNSGGLGAGESQNVPLTNGVYYTFTYSNNAQSNGICIGGTNVTGSPYLYHYTGTTGNVAIGMYRANSTWTATSATLTYQITPPTETTAGAGTFCSSTNITCTPTNGTSYWQSTTNGGQSTGTPATTENVTTSGTYYYNTDNGGCWSGTSGQAVTINYPSTAPTSISASASNTCSGSGVTLTEQGGALGTSATYQWGTGTTFGTGTIAGATGSSYTPSPSSTTSYWVSVTAPSPCNGVSNAGAKKTITVFGQPSFTTSPASPSICAGTSTSLTVALNGGISLSYQWQYYNSSTSSWGSVTTGTPAGVTYSNATTATLGIATSTPTTPPGGYQYRCVVTDAGSGCNPATSNPGTVTVNGIPLAPSVASSVTGCGQAVINAVYGTYGNTCRFYGPNSTSTLAGSGTSFAISTVGSYTYYVTSYNSSTGCESAETAVAVTVNTSFSVTSISNPLYSTYHSNDVSCYGGSNAEVQVVVTSTNYPISYQWSNGVTFSTSSGTNILKGSSTGTSSPSLPLGNYQVTITDNGGCVTITNYTAADQPTQLIPSLTTPTAYSYYGFGENCNGASAGGFTITSTGGYTPSYGYTWSGPTTIAANSTAPTGLAAGNYTVTVTDGNSCTASTSATISEPSTITFSINIGYACSGSSYTSASITVLAAGGASGTYQYSINGGATWQSSNIFSGLAGGSSYTIKVRDNVYNTCVSGTQSGTITLPASGASIGNCNFIYVTTSGDPSGTLGTQNCPVTLTQAFVIYAGNSSRNQILVQSGTYTFNSTISIPAGITVDGGYDANWIKNSNSSTIFNINPGISNNGSVGYYIGMQAAGNNFTLKDLTVNVQTAGASGTYASIGLTVYGLYISGQTGFTLSRCTINTGAGSSGLSGVYSATAGGGYSGGAGSTPYYLSNYNGYTYYYVGQSTWNGGCSAHSPSGQNGSNGACYTCGAGFAGPGGNGGNSGGCNLFGCDAGGGNGSNGGNGTTGANAAAYPAPSGPGTTGLAALYVPVTGSTGHGGDGGGGGGSGGAGAPGTCCTCDCGGGQAYGGGGGNGGAGGAGGAGGYGGGGSFAVYAWGGSGTIVDCALNPSSGGSGGSGATGHPGAGGSAGFGGLCHGGCDGGCGGNGGTGGTGGQGGQGQTGYTGVSAQYEALNSASITVSSTGTANTIPSNGVTSAQWISGCTNSQINLTKTSGNNWGSFIGSDAQFVDNLTSSTTSYTSSANNVTIYYPTSSTLGAKNLTVGSTTLSNFIVLKGNRNVSPVPTGPLPIIAPITTPCPLSNLSVSLDASFTSTMQANESGWNWTYAEISPTNNSASPTTINTSANAYGTPAVVVPPSGGWVPGATYQVTLTMNEQCCGWSIPVYTTFTIPVALSTPTIASGATTVCANSSATYGINTVSGATYTWTVSGGTFAANNSTTVTSTSSITEAVNWGGFGTGTVSVVSLNSCGTASSPVSWTVTILKNPTPSIAPVPSSASICLGNSIALNGNSTAGTGGNSTFTYAWSNGTNYWGGSSFSLSSPSFNAGYNNISVTPSPAGTYTYSIIVTEGGSGCSASVSQAVVVTPVLTASISGGTTPVCYNTSPGTFTATAGGGNGTYTYQWYNSSGAIAGATASTYTAPALTANNSYHCAVSTGGGCSSVNTGTTAIVVNGNLTASQSGGSTPVCYNTSPGTFTATGGGGTGSYTYLWYKNGTSAAITTSIYSPGNLTATSTFYCAVTSGSCGTVNTTPVTITVYPDVTAAISGGSSPLCYNSAPGTFTTTAGGGSGTYSYQWYNSSGSIGGATANTYSPGNLTVSNSYSCTVTSAGCAGVSTGSTSITVEPAVSSFGTVAASGGLTQTVCDNVAPNSGNPLTVSGAAGSSGSFTYQWYYQAGLVAAPSGTSTAGWTACGATQGSGYNTASFTAAGGSSNITYACFVTPASPVCTGQWATNDVQVTVLNSGPTESSSGGASVCIGGSVTLSSLLSVVIPATYQWYSSSSIGFTSPTTISGATSTSYAPPTGTPGTTYYEIIATFSGSGCSPATSNPQTVVVYTAPSASISGGTTPICYNTSPGTFTATGSGGSGSYSYQWYNSSGSISGATASTYTAPALTASNSYNCSVTDVAGCGTVATSTTSIVVDANLSGTSSGGVSPICYNTSPGTFTATAIGGTGSYTYQWYNGAGAVPGATASTYAPGNLTSSNSYYCVITSGTCGTFNTSIINITVRANLTASITGGSSPICYNTAPGTIRIIASGGTGTYTYQWYNGAGSIGGATASTYAPGNLTASDGFYCIVSAGVCGSVTSSTVSITVYSILSAGISGGATPICYNNDPGTFTATGTGGTGTYTYQWYNSGGSVSGQTASTYDPGNLTASNAYYCSVTSGTCGTVATSTTNITVDAVLTAGISGGTSPLCYNTSPGTFTATGGGGTGSYSYQWYNSSGSVGGATASTYAPGNLAVSDAYYCAISSGSCGTVNTSTTSITVYGNLTAVISGGTSPICYNTSPGFFVATAGGGVGSYGYQWYNSSGSIGGATASTYAPGNLVASDAYHCVVTDASCGSVSTTTTSITVDGILTATISGGASPLCYNNAPGTFTASASGGTGSYLYQWYNLSGSVSGATASTYAPGNLTASDGFYCAVTSGSCGTVNTTTTNITVYGNLTAAISGGSSPLCYNTDPGTFTATGTGGTGSYTYQWYNSSGSVGGATASTYAPGNLTASNSYYCAVTSGSCGTANTSTTAITVDAVLAVSINSGTSPICFNASPGTFTASGSGGGGAFSYTYIWYNSSGVITGATASTYAPGNLTASDSYYCVISSGSCGSANSNTAAITVSPDLSGITPTVSVNPVCITTTGGGTNIQVTNSVTGADYQLQTSLGANVGSAVAGNGSGINLPTGSMSATTTYQVVATVASSGCTYTTPADITVVALNPDIALGAQLTSQHFTFGSVGNPTLPSGWSTPNNANSNTWVLATSSPAGSSSYAYYNGTGTTTGASTGAYMQTPSGASSTTPVDLISGTIDASGYTNISVQWGAQKSADYTGSVSLYYSVDGGTSWNGPVAFTDVPANLTGTPWSLVNNSVQIKLPAAADNQPNLKFKWSANPSTDGSYYSINDIGVYGLGKILNCGNSSISLAYVNTSCSVNKYTLSADATNPWPVSPAFNYVTNTAIPGSPISVAVPSTTPSGTYNLDIKVDDGAGHSSATISFPVTTDLLMTATAAMDNCSCNYTTSGGIGNAFGNVVTVYGTGGAGAGFYFKSAGVVDTLLSTIDGSGTSYPGTTTQAGAKGVFWSKADGLSHSYTISDGYCAVTAAQVTQATKPSAIPFGSATGQPVAITTGSGGGNGISGSFNNTGLGDPNITNVNGTALTCHQTADFGNNWVTYQVNNLNSSGVPVAGDSTNNKAVVEINNNGVNLDSVEVSVYRDANLPVVPNAATTTTACYQYPQYALERHFMIKSDKSTGSNSFQDPVGVRLYFTDAEFQDLAYWTMHIAATATGESAGCAYLDTVTNLNSLYVTKYTGSNEDGNYTNNSPSGLYRLFGKNTTLAGNGPLTAIDAGQATLTTGGAANLHYVQMNVNEFSEFWLSGSQDIEALPVQMIYLEAEALNNDSIQVRWATASEINNRQFEVERSTDGNTWATINITPGHGNSATQIDYAYNDLNVVPEVNYYYRLKQVDNNGNYKYTGIVQARINGLGAFAVMNFVPNPTSGSTQLTVVDTKAQEITVDFYDMLGQKVLSSTQQLIAGTNRIDFDLRKFAAGTYSAVVTSENQLYTKKIVVTR